MGSQEAEDEQEVPRDHVGQKSDGQRERADDEGREQLDRRHEDVDGFGHARREELFLEEMPGAVGLDSRVKEGDVGHDRENQWHADD